MASLLRPRSIRARYTLAVTAFSMIALSVIGGCLDVLVRNRVQADLFDTTQRVAAEWISTMRGGDVGRVAPISDEVDLLQVVDSANRVIGANEHAAGRAPLSGVRPPVQDRIQHVTERHPDRHVMLTAIRLSPAETLNLGLDPQRESPVVYAGLEVPAILSTPTLELYTGAGVLALAAAAGVTTWHVVGRTLRPMSMVRARMSEITESDLSLRVPESSRQDEIALLASAANQTLARLECAVERQRQFASDTSHELRTPVAGLRTRLEEALLYPGEVDPRATIEAALSTTGHLEAIINDLLELSSLRAAARPATTEPIDLGALVKSEVAAQPCGTPVRARLALGLRVDGNRVQLVRVLDNLLVNARRHAKARVDVSVRPLDGHAVLTVTDDGDGIAPEDRERVFERFTRLAEARRKDANGSGLGLAISRAIADAHRGSLRIEDSPRGARFVLRLPMSDAPSPGGPADS
ncbi:HAMP domain-containing sensor histidine kinase [Sphaerisporangium sp. TRM90804]|uniref:HAMP domain-containing sensor histidine kinase n=1 Tax=Sphaerisporangium sp. TRM90804 TaxID=3031113 RepID=UPI0024487CDF|nr:HAMP domain-containing sensor histidine kinase [Sphaerisporangium sp. TRM90804]MDH2424464.1 HAMP domain-containing sensor histidine kinase [Sphaerisporangium sp. TRM90804]